MLRARSIMPSAPRSLLILVPDDVRGASTRYRVLAHLPALEAAGFQVSVRYPLRARPRRIWRAMDLVRDVATSSHHDLLLIHRKLYPPPFAPRLTRPGRRIVFDMDDAIDLPPPGYPDEARRASRYRENFAATMAIADHVLCGNDALAARVPHPRTSILPTPIDTDRFHPDALDPAGSSPVIGWVGHRDNLPYLERLAGPLRELARRRPGLRVKVICDRPPRLDGLTVDYERWTLARELECFAGMTVGIMPLDDSDWARAKCAFKAIQYMALGIPTVASPVGMNRALIQDGDSGLLADDDATWLEALDRLLGDPQLRRAVAARARQIVEASYSVRVVSQILIDELRRATA